MSSFDVSSPNATSALRNLPQDGHKNLNVVSLKMLEIAEKLESLNQQCHILEVENKVLHQAQEGGPDLNTFVNARGGSTKASTPAERRSKFLVPSVAGTSKSLSAFNNKKTFNNLSPSEQFEAVHQIAKAQSDVVCNFEGLRKAALASQMSIALKKSIGPRRDTENQTSSTDQTSVATEREPEEISFIKGILEEQDDLNEKIMEIEKERLEATLNLLSAKIDVAKEFAVTKDIYKSTIESGDDAIQGNIDEGEENDENSDNSNKDPGDEESALQKKIRKKKSQLNREEDRANQMRFLVQKLMASCPNNAMTFDEVVNQLHYDMMLKCGQDISRLRGDENV